MKLEKFTKNKKIKKVFIGSIVGIILLIGGISLYRTFAFYKEEKTFDVLNGTIPDFVYKEDILDGAYPVLKSSTGEKLIPVIIDENNGTVRKADIKDKWYSYKEKRWANAVILVEGVSEPKNNEEIREEDIESYFVWIPKYKYKIQTLETSKTGSEKAFEIQFGLEDTKDTYESCVTPNKSGDNGNCQKDYWMTHPAFTAFPGSKGFWVGKFETGYKQNADQTVCTTEGAQSDTIDSTKVIIKSNVYSWRGITVENAYQTSYNYKRKLDSHMMKNTEWGALAYLSYSKYGTCTNNVCLEIRNNNSSNFLTGVAAISVPKTDYGSYNDYKDTTPNQDNDKSLTYPRSNIASTTGNNTGIFDLNGGAWEYVMVIIDSTLAGFNDAKYYDSYPQNSFVEDKNILGDATSETKGWNNDYVSKGGNLPNSLFRGGGPWDGIASGLFYYNGEWNGEALNDRTFRIVLNPF